MSCAYGLSLFEARFCLHGAIFTGLAVGLWRLAGDRDIGTHLPRFMIVQARQGREAIGAAGPARATMIESMRIDYHASFMALQKTRCMYASTELFTITHGLW